MKIAVIFPGIGYHCDKPLLYYSGKIALQNQYELYRIAYDGLDKDMDKAFEQALAQTEAALSQIAWNRYEDVLFVSKSIGTAVASAYAWKHGVTCRNIYYTPIAQTFSFAMQPGFVFHGTADPWVETKTVEDGCRKYHLLLYVTESANHSLEVKDDAMKNLRILSRVMELTEGYITAGG